MKLRRKYTVWTYQAVQSSQGWLINGVIIKGSPGPIGKKESALSTFWKIFRSYFFQPANRKLFVLNVNGKRLDIETDSHGSFMLCVEEGNIDTLTFEDLRYNRRMAVLSKYIYHFKQSDHSHLVISDIDDTILVSHSARSLSKLWLMLFRPTPKRKPVEESEMAYHELKEAGFPFAYVSASEYNLFSLVSTFLEVHKIPIGPIYLRPYQYWKHLLGNTERKNYKVKIIQKLVAHFPEKSLVLFGDDSQHDFDVFKSIVKSFPEKVSAVYLRKTGFFKNTAGVEKEWKIPQSKVPLHYYGIFEEIQPAIQQLIHEASVRN